MRLRKNKTTKHIIKQLNIMKTTIQINGKDVEITLTKEQVAKINSQKKLDPSSCTLQDAINYLGEDDLEVINLRQLQKIDISDRILAEQEAVCIIRALNERHIFDWNNSSERKYRIWWYMDNDNFRVYDSKWDDSASCVASSLLLQNADKCKEMAEEFIFELEQSRTTLAY
jgi:hypothetical protein